MTNKKKANKLVKITVASAIALSALAQPLGSVMTVKAAEAPVTTKAESKLLQSTGLKASVPVTLKNTQFTSTETSIPGWEIAPDGNLFGTPYNIGSKQSDGYFKMGTSDVAVKPDGQGGIQTKLPLGKTNGHVIRQTIDTIPGVTYTFNWTHKGISGGNYIADLLDFSRFYTQGMDDSAPTLRLNANVFQGVEQNKSVSFMANSNKTAIALLFAVVNTEATVDPVIQFSNLSLTASATESIATPTISTVTDNDTVVTGTGEAGQNVKVTLADGSFRTGVVDEDGIYSIKILKQAKDKVIKVLLYDGQGNISPVASTTVISDVVAPPTINAVTSDDTTVKGTGVNGATVTLTIGTATYTGTVSGGEYSITIPKQSAGTVISAKESLNGKTSTSVSTTVTQGTVAAPTISAVTTDDTTVKGTGITGAVVTITIGSNTYTGAVTGGNYSITIPKQAAGTVISAKQTVNSKPSASVTTTVVSTQTTLTANDFTIGADNYIRGTYTGSDVAKLAIEVNGVVQQKITATGSPYQYYAKGKVTAGTDEVYVITYNASGVQLKRVKVNVQTLTSGTITPATFYIGTDNYVTGTLTGDVSKFSLTINGVETAKINVTTAPTFRYYANNLIRNLTDVVTVNGYDNAGKLLDSTTVTISKR
ncbi:hypothetical protein HCI99_05680 [Listeria booriae]|uniref:Bacterial Ig domain-containing protein n=1 Tax=Listeria booriae TaxID=1552123 RepID=A0A7X1CBD8_9LIST|nr:immunoglobulin-like domain-containing protein [Listeria booriae]MBC1491312.1 hypothetical protein [Listeria booriae]